MMITWVLSIAYGKTITVITMPIQHQQLSRAHIIELQLAILILLITLMV